MKAQETETVEAHAEEKEEQPGELPNIPRESRRMAPSHRHRRPDKQQLKAWQEERDKTRLDVEHVMHMYQEQQLQVSDLEKQLEQLKEREQKKSFEIHSLTQERDAFQRGDMHLKKELSKVMQRLACAEEDLEQERGRMTVVSGAPQVIEHLQMRVADYESLIVAFTEEANKMNADGDDPFQQVVGVASENTQEAKANVAELTELKFRLSVFQSRCNQAEIEAKAAKEDCIQAQAEAQVLAAISSRLAVAEEEGSASAWRYTEVRTEIQQLRESRATAEAAAQEHSDNALRVVGSRLSHAEVELEVLRAQYAEVSEELHNARTKVAEMGAETAKVENLSSISASRVVTEEEEVRASTLLHQQSETEAQELRRRCAWACLRTWGFKKAMMAANDRCDHVQNRAEEAAACAMLQLENVEVKANAWACECADLQVQAGTSNERCESVEGKAQKVRALPDSSAKHCEQVSMSASLAEVEARLHQAHHERDAAREKVEDLQCHVEAAVKDKLKAARQTLVTSSMFDRLHQNLQKQVSRSQLAMRQSRRAQMESVLGSVLDRLHTPHFSGLCDSKTDSEAEKVQRALECELAEAIQNAEEAKMRATKEIEMEKSRALAAEHAAVTLQSKLDIQKSSHDADELPRLQKEAGRAEQRVERLQAALEETEQHLVETRTSLLEALSREAAWEQGHRGDIAAGTNVDGMRSREGFELVVQSQEDCVKSLRAHLEQEAEHSDLLAIAFEEILNVVRELRAEKVLLDMSLNKSKSECRQLCADLRQTLVTADTRIAATCSKHEEETSRMTQAFNTHVTVSNLREQDILRTLHVAQATNAEFAQQEHAVATLLQKERIAAGWFKDHAECLSNELEIASQQETILEQKLADAALELRNSSSEAAALQRESAGRILAATQYSTELQYELQEHEHLRTLLETKLSNLVDVEVAAAEQSEELHNYAADLAAARHARAEVDNELETVQTALTSEVAAQGLMEEQMIVAEEISEHRREELEKLEAELQKQAVEIAGSAAHAEEAAAQAAQAQCKQLASEIESIQVVSAASELQAAVLQKELAEAKEVQLLTAKKFAEASHALEVELAEEARSRQVIEARLVAEETPVRNQLEEMESRMWQTEADHQRLTEQLEEQVICGENALHEEMLGQKEQEEQLLELSSNQIALHKALATQQRLEQEVAQTSIEEHALQEASFAQMHLEERLRHVAHEEVAFQEALSGRVELERALHAEVGAFHRCKEQVLQTETLRQDALAELSQFVARAELEENKVEEQQRAAAQELSQMAAHVALEHNEVSQHKKQMEQQATAYMEQIRNQAKAAIAQRDGQMQQLAHRLEEREAQWKEARDSLEANSLELARLNAKSHALQDSQEYSASQCAHLEESEPKLHQELSASMARSSVLSQELAQIGVEKDSLAQHLASATEELAFNRARLEALQHNGQPQTGLQENLAAQEVADLKDQLRDKQHENEIKNVECEVASQNVLHLQKLLSAKEIAFEEMSQKLEQLGCNHDFLDASKERDTLREQVKHLGKALQQQSVAAAELDKLKKQLEEAGGDCQAKSAELEVLSQELATVSAEHETMKQQVHTSAVETQSTLTQLARERDALLEQCAALQFKTEILETNQTTQASVQVETTATLEAELETSMKQIQENAAERETAKTEYEMSLKERTALREELASKMAPRDGENEELEITKQQLAQTIAERDAIEEAFQSSMQEMQRNLSQRSMEAQGLKQQLAETTTKLTQAARAQESAPIPPPSVSPPPAPASAEEEQAVSTQNKQLQRKIRDVEEEKQVMVQQLREHLMELARENYDLKQQLGGKHATPKTAVSQPANEVDESPPLLQTGSSVKMPEVQPGASSSFLSYVLSPFLTDSDKRELHAEAHAGQAGSLVLT